MIPAMAFEIARPLARSRYDVVQPTGRVGGHHGAARDIACHEVDEVRVRARAVRVVTRRAGSLVFDHMQPVREA